MRRNRLLYESCGARMETRRPPEYILEVFADPTCVKDVVKGKKEKEKQ